MARKWIKRVGLTILLAPIILVLLVIILLYIPPIQNYLRKEAVAYASQATGMQINVKRIDLRFPLRLLVRGVEVVQAPDTILTLESLSASVQVFPLFSGRAELDDVTLRGATFNTANLMDGMQLSGVLGKLSLQSDGIDWNNETALINHIDLDDTHIRFLLNDTTEAPVDTTQTAVNWQAKLQRFRLKNVFFNMEMPADSMQVAAHIGETTLKNVTADLQKQFYGLENLLISGTSVNYDTGNSEPVTGFDPSHIALQDIRVAVDSVAYAGMDMKAVIREFSMNERSGLSITSLTGHLSIDSLLIRVPELKLATPHSELNLIARAFWDMGSLEDDRLTASLEGTIGKEDVFLFAGTLPDAFQQRYPSQPITLRMNAQGNANRIVIPQIAMNLPGAFTLSGGGEILQVTDSLNRSGNIELQLRTQDLGFLTTLSGTPNDSTLVIPANILVDLTAAMRGSQINAGLRARESEGLIRLDADYNMSTDAYAATLNIDSLQIDHFLPYDSIYTVTASAQLNGQGIDFTSTRTAATVEATVHQLEYGPYHVDNITLNGELKNAVASANVLSDNDLLVMKADASYALNTPYTEANAVIDVAKVNLYELGLIPDTLRKPVSFHLKADVGRDTVNVAMNSGDLTFRLRSRGPVETLLQESTTFVDVLNKQITERKLNHAELRQALPSAGIHLKAGTDNPLYYYMALQDIKYKDVNVGFVATPSIGINGRAAIHALQMDTLRLDTVYFSIKQDTSLMAFRGGVVNGPANPQFVFNASLTGEIRTEDAGLTLRLADAKGETGVLLGVNARPREDGVLFRFTPERPTLAFRQFDFSGHDTVFVRNDYRVFADVDMQGPNGMGFRVQSMEDTDNTYLQNLDIEIRAIELAEISQMLPYFPDISGVFGLEATYKQSPENIQVSAEGNVNQFFYEGNRVGHIGVGASWLPGDAGKHYLSAYFTSDQEEVMTANGTYGVENGELAVNANLQQFPLYLANAFIPDQLVELLGYLNGNMAVTGTASQPLINGELVMNDVNLTSWQYGFDFRFDNRPLHIQNSRLTFDKFAIYATGDNPFTIDGYIDMANLTNPMAHLALQANNYQLLNARRGGDNLLYGNVFLDLNSTVTGPLSGLIMRGDINLLSSTDVTYVMIESPLGVQDRLGDLVEFTSFADTVFVDVEEQPQLALGGLDIMMNINIAPTAQVNVDLSPDRSSRIAIQGGGDLAFQYTPQGEMILSGRYTLTEGTVNYELPVIPLKEFTVNEGSYVEFSGDPMNPNLNFKASERMRVAVPNEGGNGSRMVNFDVSIEVKNRLDDMELMFNLESPDDAEVQRQLAAMDDAERSKQAITLMATGMYLAGGSIGAGDFDMGAAFNNMLQGQIANLAGDALKHANISFGMENYDGADGGKRTNYNFSYSQRLFNDRVQVVIGGSIKSGQSADESDTFIDNVSLEYRLDDSGTRFVRLFHNKEYENILESNITETGGGIVLRKKVSRLGELFIFRRKKK